MFLGWNNGIQVFTLLSILATRQTVWATTTVSKLDVFYQLLGGADLHCQQTVSVKAVSLLRYQGHCECVT